MFFSTTVLFSFHAPLMSQQPPANAKSKKIRTFHTRSYSSDRNNDTHDLTFAQTPPTSLCHRQKVSNPDSHQKKKSKPTTRIPSKNVLYLRGCRWCILCWEVLVGLVGGCRRRGGRDMSLRVSSRCRW